MQGEGHERVRQEDEQVLRRGITAEGMEGGWGGHRAPERSRQRAVRRKVCRKAGMWRAAPAAPRHASGHRAGAAGAQCSRDPSPGLLGPPSPAAGLPTCATAPLSRSLNSSRSSTTKVFCGRRDQQRVRWVLGMAASSGSRATTRLRAPRLPPQQQARGGGGGGDRLLAFWLRDRRVPPRPTLLLLAIGEEASASSPEYPPKPSPEL